MAESNLCLDGDLENQSSSRPMIDDGAIDSRSDKETTFSLNKQCSSQSVSAGDMSNNVNLQLTCFTEEAHDATLNFQIISLSKQIYIWIGCNSAKLGHLYAGAPTRPNNTVSVTSLLGGGADSTGAGIARRLVLRTGLNIILACNIPKGSPMLEAHAERILIQKLNSLGYSKEECKRRSPVSVV
ncbi:uncharacterized protein LOC131071102 [Cryptomeria japonica]|uniref:uncharacterized protein LOC131071102 n=1 Tax=Cryptomeria japonica TaxID=3369 RepID=UPI0025ACC1FA|nr:uncharacterized protein LOC131071102 [Cryptomeria japonica]XP_059070112.1 uncharacterized protein LOC131071102 [Cryptomeria japonica]